MGLFDFFGGKSKLAKHAECVADKRAQAGDRYEAMQALAAIGSEEAFAAILVRFSYYADPSITDQEEKDEAFRLLVKAGEAKKKGEKADENTREKAVAAVIACISKAESVSWPMRILESLVDNKRFVSELLKVLSKMDVEYERDPQRKHQILSALEEARHPGIAAGVARFLDDANEGTRFHAAGALFAQEDPSPAQEEVLEAIKTEDSVRVRVRLLTGMSQHGWAVEQGDREAVRAQLPEGWTLDKGGVPQKK